jgi:hypothetical protein
MSKLLKEFEGLNNDKERWLWVLENKDKIFIELNNDITFVLPTIECNENEEEEYTSFDNFLGDKDGVLDLLQALGINANFV